MVVPVGRAADHGDDLVVLDEAGGEGARLVGIAAIVIDHQLDLLAVDAACRVDLVDIDPERLVLRLAKERGRSGRRENRADLDGVLRESAL